MNIIIQAHGNDFCYDYALNRAKELGYTPTKNNITGGLGRNDDQWSDEINIGVEVEESFLNCTPHPITIMGKTIQSYANVRLEESKTLLDKIDGVEIYSVKMDKIVHNHYQLGIMLEHFTNEFNIIVSAMVAPLLKQKYPNLRVFSPLDLKRDSEGKVIGCESLREW